IGVLPWLTATVSLLLAFAVPTTALLAAMYLAEIRQPTVAQLRAKRVAFLAVAAPTLFTFIGVVLSMLGDRAPDTWFWVACWVLAVVAVLYADRNAPAPAKVEGIPVALRVAHGISALVIIGIFLALHIANHLTGLVGPSTYDAVMKIFRHVYRTELVQPLVVTLFLFQIGTGLYLVWRLLVTWIRFSSSPAPTLALTRDGISPRVPPQALSRIHGTSVSCRIIGWGCSSSFRTSRPGRVS